MAAKVNIPTRVEVPELVRRFFVGDRGLLPRAEGYCGGADLAAWARNRRCGRITVSTLIGIIVLCTAASCPSPQCSRVYYARGEPSPATHVTTYDVYSRGAACTETALTIEPEFNDDGPSLSPDGRTYAFSSDRTGNNQIFLMAADGSNVRRITTNGYSDIEPDWSPDGSKIAFASIRNGVFGIYVIDVDGNNERVLSVNNDRSPDWSATGSIAFVSDRPQGRGVFAMNDDGTNQRTITSGSNNYEDPVWSSDGKRLAYAVPTGIWWQDADVSATPQHLHSGTASSPSWSSDGQWIAYVRLIDQRYSVARRPVNGSPEVVEFDTGDSRIIDLHLEGL